MTSTELTPSPARRRDAGTRPLRRVRGCTALAGVMVGFLGFFAGAGPLRADALIVDSTNPEIEVGWWLTNGTVLETGAGAELTLLEEGDLRFLAVPAGRFTYTDTSGPAAPQAMRTANLIASLLDPQDQVLTVGGQRGRRRAGACPSDAAETDPVSVQTVAALAKAGCDSAAGAMLRALIDAERPTAQATPGGR